MGRRLPDALQEKQISCTCRETNRDSSVVNSIGRILYHNKPTSLCVWHRPLHLLDKGHPTDTKETTSINFQDTGDRTPPPPFPTEGNAIKKVEELRF